MPPQAQWLTMPILMHVKTYRLILSKAAEQHVSPADLIKLAVEAYNPEPVISGEALPPNYSPAPYIVQAAPLKCLDSMSICRDAHQHNPLVPDPQPSRIPQTKKAA